MRLLFATDGIFPDFLGGMSRHSYFLVKALSNLDLAIDVIHPTPGKHYFESPNIREFSFPMPDFRLPYHYLRSCRAYSVKIAQFIRNGENRYDAAYGQGLTLWAYLKTRSFPCLVNPHGLEMFQPANFIEKCRSLPFRSIVNYQAKYADRMVSLGGRLTQILKNECNLPDEKIAEIPNGVDLDYLDSKTSPEKSKIPRSFLFVGRLVANKGLLQLMEACNRLKNQDIRLFIAGNGPLRKRLESINRHPGLQFLGPLSEEELFQWYSQVEAFIFPSLGEGMPTAVLEAMACRLPVIATDVGATGALVDSSNGFLIQPGQPDEIQQAILKFLTIPTGEKIEMGFAGRKKVETKFQWKAIAQQTFQVCQAMKIFGGDNRISPEFS